MPDEFTPNAAYTKPEVLEKTDYHTVLDQIDANSLLRGPLTDRPSDPAGNAAWLDTDNGLLSWVDDTAGQWIPLPTIGSIMEVVAPSLGWAHDTLADAHDALPSSNPQGGTIYLAETCTETSDVRIWKRTTIIGQGSPPNVNAPAYVDLNGYSLDIGSDRGVTIRDLQIQNGGAIVGDHGVFTGRSRIELTVLNPPNTGIEIRGAQQNSAHDFQVSGASTAIRINLDSDQGDFYNQNTTSLVARNSDHGVEMTGSGTNPADLRGNDFLRWNCEDIATMGWSCDDNIVLRANKMFGYGVHDGGVDVQPYQQDLQPMNNLINWDHIRHSGTLNIGGEIHANSYELQDINVGPNTVIKSHDNRDIPQLAASTAQSDSLSVRQINTDYQNDTNYPLRVVVSLRNQIGNGDYTDQFLARILTGAEPNPPNLVCEERDESATDNGGLVRTVSAIVPPGDYYRVNTGGRDMSIEHWSEQTIGGKR